VIIMIMMTRANQSFVHYGIQSPGKMIPGYECITPATIAQMCKKSALESQKNATSKPNAAEWKYQMLHLCTQTLTDPQDMRESMPIAQAHFLKPGQSPKLTS